jgi:hypothetical protein
VGGPNEMMMMMMIFLKKNAATALLQNLRDSIYGNE